MWLTSKSSIMTLCILCGAVLVEHETSAFAPRCFAYCIVFIHLYSASHSTSLSEALPTTAMTLCRSLHVEPLQATVIEGFAQGPCVAARAGFEHTTLRAKGFDSTDAPPRPTSRP